MDLKYSGVGLEPLSSAEVKNYLKADYSTDDALISMLITGCRELMEQYTGRSLVVKTIEYFEAKDYDFEIELPYPEHNQVTAVTLNTVDVLADCIITGNVQKIVKLPAQYNYLNADADGVKITYTTLGTCPSALKMAILKSIAEIYEKRGNTFEGSVAELSENAYAIGAKYMIM